MKTTQAGSFVIEGTMKVRCGECRKASVREASGVAKRIAHELSFEEDAESLVKFGKFLERVRNRLDCDTLPPVAVVRAYRTFIRMY